MAGISQRIDPRIVDKIHGLVEDVVRQVNEVKRHLKVFVRDSLFAGSSIPPKSNKRFFPGAKTIRNHMHIAIIKQRHTKVDQANLLEKTKVWRSQNEGDSVEFRPYLNPEVVDNGEEDSEDEKIDDDSDINDDEEMLVDDGTLNKGLLFVYQAQWQKRLLNRYGNELCLLDATYKTTKYCLPLYFLVVKTNIEYKVVAAFVTQSETTEAIKEALSVIMKWNPIWKPKHFMVDYALEEILSVQQLFPGTCNARRQRRFGVV